jgi:phytoene synthase
MDSPNHYLVSADYEKESNEILFNKGKTFYWAKFFLSQHMALQATRLYRFCRYIDDLADETPDKNLAKNALNCIVFELQQGTSNDRVVTDAMDLFKDCGIAVEIPIELINGVLSDLSLVHIKTEAQLLKYCYQVAGTVGLMMCKALNVQSSSALYHAVDLGIAMQLTNICRDVRADALMARIYLPESILGTMTPNQLVPLDEANRKTVIETVSLLLKRADQYYTSGYTGLCHLPFRSRMSILIAAKLYQRIGAELQREQFKGMTTKVYVPIRLKLLVSVQVCFKAIFDQNFWFYRAKHNAKLHQFIAKLPFCNG